jgi:hypothetical protein
MPVFLSAMVNHLTSQIFSSESIYSGTIMAKRKEDLDEIIVDAVELRKKATNLSRVIRI